MAKQRKHYGGAEKMAILREHLLERVPISEVCQKHGLQPTVFYTWQKRLFEGGAAVFEDGRAGRKKLDGSARRIEALQAKLARKDEVLAEIMEEHVALKKSLGEA
jgi:transposase-like protein